MSRPTRRSYVNSLAAFRSGNDTPRSFLERCLACLDEWEGKIHAFVNTNLVAARAAADRSSERWQSGRPLSPIDGMPIGVKDIMETADMPTEQGSPLFANWRSVRDTAAVAGLRETGPSSSARRSRRNLRRLNQDQPEIRGTPREHLAAPAAVQQRQLRRESCRPRLVRRS